MKRVLLPMVVLFFLTGCNAGPGEEAPLVKGDHEAFGEAWYQGKAELSRFTLEQSRYGETHPGDAVQIFVTEPFLAEKQVKHEFGDDESYTVLKLNFTKKFLTGIYPYSLMTSAFTRVDFERPETAKVSFSAQEWCGHQFSQLNRRGDGYDHTSFSYFQSEGDQERRLPDVWLEDDLWTRLRIAPETLPLGEVRMIPALEHLRLRHVEPKAMKARGSMEEVKDERFGKESVYRYEVAYAEGDRSLAIFFEKAMPYAILGWVETLGDSETVAVRTHSIWLDYWSRNRPEDRALREELGLSQ